MYSGKAITQDILFFFLLGLKETLLKVLGIWEVLKIFLWLLPSYCTIGFILEVVLYKVQKVLLNID